jgi:hypothetical protein
MNLIAPATYDAREIEDLPAPVRRYFRAVLRDGQPIVSGARLSQEGEFRQGDREDGWRPPEKECCTRKRLASSPSQMCMDGSGPMRFETACGFRWKGVLPVAHPGNWL